MPFLLLSPGFSPGAALPSAFTCDGSDFSPPLEWSGEPPNTASYVVLVEDPDAPDGVFRHWAAYDIAAANSGLPGGYHAGQPATWMALAAGWSGGSIVAPDLGPVPAPPHQTARAVRAGLMIAMAQIPSENTAMLVKPCIKNCIELAAGVH